MILVKADFCVFIFAAALLSMLPTLIDGQSACPKGGGIYVGNLISSTPIPAQNGHGQGQTVIVYDSNFVIPCACGVIAAWDVVRYNNFADSCDVFQCDVKLMVYRNLNVSAMTATLVGQYNAININNLTASSTYNVVNIQIPQSEMIPVKYGDFLGWDANPSAVTYYEEAACTSSCTMPSTSKYFWGSYKSSVTTGSQIGFFNGPANSYNYYRYFGFRATVWGGSTPYFTNLPQTLNLTDTTAVGTVVFTVLPIDDETKQTLTLTLRRSCPPNYFSFNQATGEVTLIQSLIGSLPLHSMTIEVSDECFTNSSDLTINIISVLPLTVEKKAELPVVATPVGITLLTVTGLASLVAIGTSIGICFTSSQISDITKEIAGLKPGAENEPKVNNRKTNNFDRYNPTNRPKEENYAKRDEPWNGDSSKSKSPSSNNRTITPNSIRMTPVEHPDQWPPSGRIPSSNPPSQRSNPISRNSYPPRDMLYW